MSTTAPFKHTPGPQHTPTVQRVTWAKLSYRTTPYDQWTVVESNYELDEDEPAGKILLCNVNDVEIDGTGITVFQPQENYHPHLVPVGKRQEARARCKVFFPKSDNQDLHFAESLHDSEGTRPAHKIILMQFTRKQPPIASNGSQIPDTAQTKHTDPQAAFNAMASGAANLPLARFAALWTPDQSYDVQLELKRQEARRFRWSWLVVLYFALGNDTYHTSRDVEAQKNLESMPFSKLLTLKPYATELEDCGGTHKLLPTLAPLFATSSALSRPPSSPFSSAPLRPLSQSSTPLPPHLRPSTSFSLGSRPSRPSPQSSTSRPPPSSHISRSPLSAFTSPNAVKTPETKEDKKRKRAELVAEREALLEDSRRKIAKYDEDIAKLDAELQ